MFGQVVNHSKSLIHFSKNTGQDLRANILNYLGMIYSHNSKYLDLLFCRYNSKSQVFRDIIDKVESKLARWKIKVLSFAGGSTLIKSTV